MIRGETRRMQQDGYVALRDRITLRANSEAVLVVDRVNKQIFFEISALLECGRRQETSGRDCHQGTAVGLQRKYTFHTRVRIAKARNQQHEFFSSALAVKIV